MKIKERTGKWVEIERTKDRTDEITIRAPNTIWAAWMSDVYIRDEDLAGFLRSIGWQVVLPTEKAKAAPATATPSVAG